MDSRTSAPGHDLTPPTQPRLQRRDPVLKAVAAELGDRPLVMLCAPTAAEFNVIRRALARGASRFLRSPRNLGIPSRSAFAVRGGKGFWLFQTGLGTATAEMANQLCRTVDLDAICLLGYAGGLDADLPLGCIVEPSLIHGEAMLAPLVPVPLGVGERVTPVLTVAQPVLSSAAKFTLHQKHQAGIVEMEAFPLSVVCQWAGKPLHIVKTISDDAYDELPREIVACIRPNGDLSSARLAGTLAIRPRLWPKLGKLWKRNAVAARALERATERVVEILSR